MQTLDADLLDLIEHPVFVLEPDPAGMPRYVAFNAYACKVLGRPVTEILGRTAAEVYAGRLGETVFAHHVETMRSGIPVAYETRLPVLGSERLVRTTLRPVCDEGGAVLRLVGSSVDVSGGQIPHQVRAELATRTNEMQDYIELAAHDLRAPMRNVTYIAEMLRDGFQDLGDGKLELIDLLEDIGQKASTLIGDVLSHAQACSLARETVQFDFAQLVWDVLAVLDPLGRCVIQLDADRVEGDRAATQIILRNLIDNALRCFDAEASVADKLTLEIHLNDLEDGFFEITISDDGPGLSDPALLFFETGELRVDSGFGLLGVRRLIHARGGSVKAMNRSGGPGAVIAVTLPGRLVPEISEETYGAA